jgi:hypothetical protein
MSLKEYINSLTEKEQDAYAIRCGTTGKYLRAHIRYARKECRKDLRKALSRESNGVVTEQEVLDHFFKVDTNAA